MWVHFGAFYTTIIPVLLMLHSLCLGSTHHPRMQSWQNENFDKFPILTTSILAVTIVSCCFLNPTYISPHLFTQETEGPAMRASAPVSTKIPAPMQAPMPNKVSSTTFRRRSNSPSWPAQCHWENAGKTLGSQSPFKGLLAGVNSFKKN